MYTSVMLVALSGSVVASFAAHDLAWQTDYAQARKMGESDRKPLAVFIGTGATGHDKVCRDGKLSAEVQKVLADNYVCVYVDGSTPAGEKLAKELAITQGKGLVISDRSGQLQAFYHDGDLSETALSQWLRRYADPNIVVRTTVVNDSNSQVSMYYSPNGSMGYTSYYPPNGYAPNGGMAGYYGYGFQPGWSGGGSSCVGGHCGGGRRR